MGAFVIVIGGMIALPAAALAGGSLLLWERQRGSPLALQVWLDASSQTMPQIWAARWWRHWMA